MLVEWSKLGYASERDLFIARAALQFLSFGNLRDANAVQGAFKARLQQDGETPPDSPLMNFVGFLLRACERDAAPLFQVLRQKLQIRPLGCRWVTVFVTGSMILL